MNYPKYDCSNAINEALTDLLHPEFGSGWDEPDGVLYRAHQAGREQALDDVVTMLSRTDAEWGWAWPGDKGQAVEYVRALREKRIPMV